MKGQLKIRGNFLACSIYEDFNPAFLKTLENTLRK